MKILFFSPNAYIWKATYPELSLAEQLVRAGHEVNFMRCDGMFDVFCNSMSASGLNPKATKDQKKEICLRCKRTRDFTKLGMGSNFILAEDFLDTDCLNRVEKILETVNETNWQDLEVNNVPVGRYAAYEFLMRNKLRSTNIPDDLWDDFLIALRYGLQVLFIADSFFRNNKIEALIVYNHLHSLNRIFSEVAQNYGINAYTIQANGGLDKMERVYNVVSASRLAFPISKSTYWSNYSSSPLASNEIEIVSKHLSALFKARSPWVYSIAAGNRSSDEILSILSIERNRKILLLTMSSEDELFTAEFVGYYQHRQLSTLVPLFTNQLEWAKWLISYVGGRNDFHLIIRIHPREFPNKRENVRAPHLDSFISSLGANLPQNVSLNLPDQEISIYDLIPIVNVVLNSTSSVGAEFAAFGIPVITHDVHLCLTYPKEITRVVSVLEDFEKQIDQAVGIRFDLEKCKIAFRWLAFRLDFQNEQLEPMDWKLLKPVSDLIRRPRNKYGLYLPTFPLRLIFSLFSQLGKRTFKKKVLAIEMIENGTNSIERYRNTRALSTPSTLRSEEREILLALNRLKQKLK